MFDGTYNYKYIFPLFKYKFHITSLNFITMYFQSFTCAELPFCDGDGKFYAGPVCDATNACSCIDAITGETAMSSEGIQLVSSVYLPDDFFGSWMSGTDFDCALFSSDAAASLSLTDPSLGLPADLLASIAGLD